ncbi:hypothetical protein [Piscirickettsia salmonis]|uniref:hypothetical protein n=1 Tax=Piscirickettsia salmonis TaxID=1238 RepID=UPI0007C8AC89|nr:hypothetical protein A0O36_02854 [Piscirickettsiaceae bacterium NZ-RLO1]
MPKFHHSFYLSLLASDNSDPFAGDDAREKSFFSQKDKDLSRQYTVDMYTQQRRKSLLKNEIPFIRLNFPYTENAPAEWQVNQDKTNKQVADEMVKAVLIKAAPFTRIYIEPGGSLANESLSQLVSRPVNHPRLPIIKVNDIRINEIGYQQLAELLDQSLPHHAKNNLQIKLVTSHAEGFAENLMHALHAKGFKKTSVLAYDEEVYIIGGRKSSKNKNKFKISNIQGASGYDLIRCRKVENPDDNKKAFHNYEGRVAALTSREFKKTYLTDFSRVTHHEINGLTAQQEEVILLKNLLIQSLDKFNEPKERQQLESLTDSLLSIDTQTILDQPEQTEYYIQQMLNELKSFAKHIDSHTGSRKLFKQGQNKQDSELVLSAML